MEVAFACGEYDAAASAPDDRVALRRRIPHLRQTAPLATGAFTVVNRRRALVALLVSAATVAGFAGPAGAAVPKTPADFVLACRVGSGKSAQLWTVHHFTAKKQDAAHPVVSRSALGQKSSAVLTKV